MVSSTSPLGKAIFSSFVKKTLWQLSMDVIQLPKATEPLRGDSLLFPTKSPGSPGPNLINLRRMKG